MKLTGWFPASIKPIREGYYRTRGDDWIHTNENFYLFSWWDGNLWRWAALDNVILDQHRCWQGRAK